jgi:hypothetical protein
MRNTQSPGNTTNHQAEKCSLASFNKLPQVMTFNGTPTPIKDIVKLQLKRRQLNQK